MAADIWPQMDTDDADGDSNLVDQRALVNVQPLTEACAGQRDSNAICVHLRHLRP
jgi:hypothetical protein